MEVDEIGRRVPADGKQLRRGQQIQRRFRPQELKGADISREVRQQGTCHSAGYGIEDGFAAKMKRVRVDSNVGDGSLSQAPGPAG